MTPRSYGIRNIHTGQISPFISNTSDRTNQEYLLYVTESNDVIVDYADGFSTPAAITLGFLYDTVKRLQWGEAPTALVARISPHRLTPPPTIHKEPWWQK